MKCSDILRYLPLYLDNECEPADCTNIQAHLESCPSCRAMLRDLQTESEVVMEAIQLERLPDSFVISVLDQLEPYPATRPTDSDGIVAAPLPAPVRRRRSAVWKRAVIAACAAVFLGIAAGTFISPAFAAYVSSFISRIGGELGLKRAAEQGFNIPVNQSVTDQGVTLRINDIVADPTRLVVTYVLEDENKKPLPRMLVYPYEENKVYLTDKEGNVINEMPNVFREGTGYVDYTFMLQKNTPNDLIVHFDITTLGPAAKKQGNWKLDVPVDLAKSMQATKYTPLTANSYSSHGIDFSLEGVTYGPSATAFTLATKRTPDEELRLKEIKERLKVSQVSIGDYKLSYHIEDKDGRIVARDGSTDPEINRHIYFTPGYSSPPAQDGDDTWRWYGAIVPSEKPEELWFALDSIEKTEEAHFSIPFRPADLQRTPVTQRYDELSSTYTVKQMTKGTDPETNEPVWLISVYGEMPNGDFPKWQLHDKTGNSYEVRTDYSTSSVSGDKNGDTLEQTLIVKGLPSLPEKLTLSLLTVQKVYTDLNWKVPIPPER